MGTERPPGTPAAHEADSDAVDDREHVIRSQIDDIADPGSAEIEAPHSGVYSRRE